jgi:hypothetical protein
MIEKLVKIGRNFANTEISEKTESYKTNDE